MAGWNFKSSPSLWAIDSIVIVGEVIDWLLIIVPFGATY